MQIILISLYVAEANGGQISNSATASFVFSENAVEDDTERSVAFVYYCGKTADWL